MIAIACFALTISLACAAFQLGARYAYSYAVTAQYLEVRLFGQIPIYRIARSSIATLTLSRVRRAGIVSALTTLRLGNRLFGTAITIERRHGFPRYVIITPDDPPSLMSELATQRA